MRCGVRAGVEQEWVKWTMTHTHTFFFFFFFHKTKAEASAGTGKPSCQIVGSALGDSGGCESTCALLLPVLW